MINTCFQTLGKVATSVDFDGVCWFHLTRVGIETNFSEGILPLHLSIERVWNFLYSLISYDFSETDWNTFKQLMNSENILGENNDCSNSRHLYQLKTKNHRLGGPYAMLVKEISFNSKQVGNHDYLRIPEIVEDICHFFDCNYKNDLEAKYLAATKPCIVKFISQNVRNDLLETSLFYLYSRHKNFELSWHCNTCFDGEGHPIPKEHILNMEWL